MDSTWLNLFGNRGNAFTIPEHLDSPEFRQAWQRWLDWLTYRREESCGNELERICKQDLAGMDAPQAVAAIDHSIQKRFLRIQRP